LDLRFAGSNPAENDGFLRAIKIRSTASFGGKCRKILRYVEEVLRRQRSEAISRKVTFVSLLHISDGNFQRALVDKAGIITNKMGTHNISEVVSMQGSPCGPTL
jgi:hypothetical protein